MKSNYVFILFLVPIILVALMSCAPKPPSEEPAPNPTPVEQPTPAVQPSPVTPEGFSSESAYTTEGADGHVTTSMTPDPNAPVTSPGGVTDGGTTVTSGLPERWPASVPIMPGFTVVMGVDGLDDQNDPGIMVSMTGSVPLTEAAAFYSALEGWQKDEGAVMPEPTEDGFVMALIRGDKEKLEIGGQKDAEGNSVLNLLYSTGRR
jgi:hypothetical protein